MIHLDILDKKRLLLLPRLSFLRKYNFYLAGGTGLALQLGHRISIDFDFYRQEPFEPQKIFQEFQEKFAEDNLMQIQINKGTLTVRVNDIEISLFRYRYPLARPLIKTEHADLASLEDIGAMKIIAVMQRGTKRDFVDIYFLMENLSIKQLLDFAEKRYKGFNKYLALQGLLYFKDADTNKALKMLKPIPWSKVKKEIIVRVNAFKKSALKQ
ncbi:MAG: nucleotidyl transferase AbiEii/AbiGii toxin family protein [bacterium]